MLSIKKSRSGEFGKLLRLRKREQVNLTGIVQSNAAIEQGPGLRII